MSDRELLELAAKAAGHDDAKYSSFDGMDVRYGFDEAMWSEKRHDETGQGYWNPPEDDGEALRLAVKLLLDIDFYTRDDDTECVCVAFPGCGVHEELGNDPYAALRRAIVRAAAEIGRKP